MDIPIERDLLTTDPDRVARGYQLRHSCANCQHLLRSDRLCLKHGFRVNLDRGICKDFDGIVNQKKRSVSL